MPINSRFLSHSGQALHINFTFHSKNESGSHLGFIYQLRSPWWTNTTLKAVSQLIRRSAIQSASLSANHLLAISTLSWHSDVKGAVQTACCHPLLFIFQQSLHEYMKYDGYKHGELVDISTITAPCGPHDRYGTVDKCHIMLCIFFNVFCTNYY